MRHNGQIDLKNDQQPGTEPADHPAWEKRALKLVRHVREVGSATTEELLRWAHEQQGWHEQTAKNVLAWAELDWLACDEGGVWRPAEAEDACLRPRESAGVPRTSSASLMF